MNRTVVILVAAVVVGTMMAISGPALALATASSDQTARVWDATSGEEVARLGFVLVPGSEWGDDSPWLARVQQY